MGPADLLDRIQTVLHERFGLERAVLGENARLRDLGVDSLHVAEIVIDLENELGKRLDDLSMPPNPSLGEVVAVLSKNLASQA
jgi:acyl carrier protein